jgi:hypothetical protein
VQAELVFSRMATETLLSVDFRGSASHSRFHSPNPDIDDRGTRAAPRVRMAISCKSSTRSRLRRSIAVFGAALILVAQFVAAVHRHPGVESARTVSSAQLSLDTGLCALCQVAFHSNLNPTSAPFIEPLEIRRAISSIDSGLGFTWFDFASALTRAPPAAA